MIRANKQRIKKRAMQAFPDYGRKTAPKSRPGLSEGLALVGGMLQDMDGLSQGNFQRAMTRTQRKLRLKDESKQAELDEKRRQAILSGIKLSPEQRALMQLGDSDRSFIYGLGRDGVADARDLRNFSRDVLESDRTYDTGRTDRAADVDYRDRRATRSDLENDRNFTLANDRFSHNQSMDHASLDLKREAIADDEDAVEGWQPATPDQVAAYGYDPEKVTAQMGPNGEFKVIREQKPMVSSESMARVASNLPNLIAASDNLNELFTTQQPGLMAPEKGYRPGHDWGAQAVSAIPDWGLLEGVAKTIGGKDYQTYETEYSNFEAAALPIVSGSAVSDTEAKRFLNSIKIQMGDNDDIVTRKLQAKENFVRGLQAAATGDADMLQQVLDGTYDRPHVGGAGVMGSAATFPQSILELDDEIARLEAEIAAGG